VIDVDLPDGGGWELAREVRGRPDARTLPIVITSARTRPGAPEARGLGVRWMTKPYHLRQARLLLTPLVRAAQPAVAEPHSP
jgi:DNA-binding response OmpR family regulator